MRGVEAAQRLALRAIVLLAVAVAERGLRQVFGRER
jgi:hypothetical protein